VCCSVLQCVAGAELQCQVVLQCAAVCYSVPQYVAVCCSVLQCAAEAEPQYQVVLQCVAVCCRVLQCVAGTKSPYQVPIDKGPPSSLLFSAISLELLLWIHSWPRGEIRKSNKCPWLWPWEALPLMFAGQGGVTWLIHMWYDSIMNSIWLICMWVWIVHTWHDSFVCDMTHSYVT